MKSLEKFEHKSLIDKIETQQLRWFGRLSRIDVKKLVKVFWYTETRERTKTRQQLDSKYSEE